MSRSLDEIVYAIGRQVTPLRGILEAGEHLEKKPAEEKPYTQEVLQRQHLAVTFPFTGVTIQNIVNLEDVAVLLDAGINLKFDSLSPAIADDQLPPPSSEIPKIPLCVIDHLKFISTGGLISGYDKKVSAHTKLARRQAEIAWMLVCRLAVISAWDKQGHTVDSVFAKEMQNWRVRNLRNLGHGFTEGYLKTLGPLLYVILTSAFVRGKINGADIDLPQPYASNLSEYLAFLIPGFGLSALLAWANIPMQLGYASFTDPFTKDTFDPNEMLRIKWDRESIETFLAQHLAMIVNFEEGELITWQPLEIKGDTFSLSAGEKDKNLVTLNTKKFNSDMVTGPILQMSQGFGAEDRQLKTVSSSGEKSEKHYVLVKYPQDSLLRRTSDQQKRYERAQKMKAAISSWMQEQQQKLIPKTRQSMEPGDFKGEDTETATKRQKAEKELALARKTHRDTLCITAVETFDGMAVAAGFIFQWLAVNHPNWIDSFGERAAWGVAVTMVGAAGGYFLKAISTLGSTQRLALVREDYIDRLMTGVVHQLPEHRSALCNTPRKYYTLLSWGLPLLFASLHGLAINQANILGGGGYQSVLKDMLIIWAVLSAMIKTRQFDFKAMARNLGLSEEEIEDPFGPDASWKNEFVKFVGADWYTMNSKIDFPSVNQYLKKWLGFEISIDFKEKFGIDISGFKKWFAIVGYFIGLGFLAYEAMKTSLVQSLLPPIPGSEIAFAPLAATIIGDIHSRAGYAVAALGTLVARPQSGQMKKSLDVLQREYSLFGVDREANEPPAMRSAEPEPYSTVRFEFAGKVAAEYHSLGESTERVAEFS